MKKPKTGRFKVSFLSRRSQGKIRIKKELTIDIRIFWVNFFFKFKIRRCLIVTLTRTGSRGNLVFPPSL